MFELTAQRDRILHRALRRLAVPERRFVTVDFFNDTEVEALRIFALAQEFRTAQTEIKHKGRCVHQDFDVCFPAPRVGVFESLANMLEQGIYAYGAPDGFQLNDFAIQNYPKMSRGIGIHRDGLRYPHVVLIITLAGSSRLFACDNRDGQNKRRIDDRPGRLVLLSAAGFGDREGEDARPLHGVDQLSGGRLSLGLRYHPINIA